MGSNEGETLQLNGMMLDVTISRAPKYVYSSFCRQKVSEDTRINIHTTEGGVNYKNEYAKKIALNRDRDNEPQEIKTK